MRVSWNEPLWLREGEMLARDDAFQEITKVILLEFSLFPNNLDIYSLQESLISLLESKINTNFIKWKE